MYISSAKMGVTVYDRNLIHSCEATKVMEVHACVRRLCLTVKVNVNGPEKLAEVKLRKWHDSLLLSLAAGWI